MSLDLKPAGMADLHLFRESPSQAQTFLCDHIVQSSLHRSIGICRIGVVVKVPAVCDLFGSG